ncbi:MAG: hypothetical protein IJ268_04670 [Proteobacteria bacterium]|nr:hypothetical protein [Pseudomonadota bacterium]MBQ9243869.1 hypothetical protein [Pseudomonadota bacterium]
MAEKIPEPPEMPLNYEVSCEIELTPEQRRIVKEKTGRDMTVLILEDSDGRYTHGMDTSSPEDFTLLAIKQAERLNEYDEDYHAYLTALADYQDNADKPDPMDEMAENLQIAAMQEAERLKLFYMKEAEESEAARNIARIAWGKKDQA